MRVLFCLPGNDWGGAEREPVCTLVEALECRRDIDLSFIQFDQAAESVSRSGRSVTVPLRSSRTRCTLGLYRQERKAMAAEMRCIAPDVIHVHWTQLGHGLAAADSGIPYVITVHDAAIECAFWNMSPRPASILAGLAGVATTRHVLLRASRIIAVSPHVAEHVKKYFVRGCEPKVAPIEVVPNPLGTLVQREDAEIPAGIDLQIEGARVLFVAVGYWGRLKGLDLALRSFASARKRIPGARLLLVGKDLGPESSCERWAKSQGVSEGVVFAGGIPHGCLIRILRERSHCLLHPSRTEGFGLVVAEAMSMEVPVIASASGSLPWLLGGKNAGSLMDGRDMGDWSGEMVRIAAGGGVAAAKEARIRVMELCDPQHVAEKHLEVYRKVINRSTSSIAFP